MFTLTARLSFILFPFHSFDPFHPFRPFQNPFHSFICPFHSIHSSNPLSLIYRLPFVADNLGVPYFNPLQFRKPRKLILVTQRGQIRCVISMFSGYDAVVSTYHPPDWSCLRQLLLRRAPQSAVRRVDVLRPVVAICEDSLFHQRNMYGVQYCVGSRWHALGPNAMHLQPEILLRWHFPWLSHCPIPLGVIAQWLRYGSMTEISPSFQPWINNAGILLQRAAQRRM